MDDPVTIWYRSASGAVSEATGFPPPELPEGAEPISPDEYRSFVRTLAREQAAAVAAEAAAVARRSEMMDAALARYLADQQTTTEGPE